MTCQNMLVYYSVQISGIVNREVLRYAHVLLDIKHH